MFTKITFKDNGIGFEKEYNRKLFIIFKRLHSNASVIPGKGIGLATCKKIMTNHNGYITAKGELGVGASFNLYFPLNDETE
jgi:light-regulated signal transduction histidine kinase (bacteriophytochrome)